MSARPVDRGEQPWNKGLLIGQKKPLEPKHVWSIRVRLEIARSRRDLAIFNLAIDSKLRACDLVKLRLDDVCSGVNVRHRATIVQKKTGRPVQFEITEQSRSSVEAWLPGPCPFKCLLKRRSLSARPRGLACSLKRGAAVRVHCGDGGRCSPEFWFRRVMASQTL